MQMASWVHQPTRMLIRYQHLCSCFLDPLLPPLPPLLQPGLSKPRLHTLAPLSKGIRQFVLSMLLLIKFLLIFPISPIHSLTYSFSKYLLSTSQVPDVVIGTGNTAMNKTDGNPCRGTFWRGLN